MLALAIEGMPLGRSLADTAPRYQEQVYALTVSRVSALGVESTVVPAIVWCLVYGLAVYALARSRGIKVRPFLRWAWPITAFFILVALSALRTPDVGKVASNLFHGVGITLVAIAAAEAYRTDSPRFFWNVSIVLALNLVVQVISVILFPSDTVAFDGRWAGMTGHPNTLGSIAFCGFWSATATYSRARRAAKLVALICMGVSVLMLWGSNSVTSMVASGVALFVIVVGRGLGKRFIRARIVVIFLLCVALAGATFFAASNVGGILGATASLAGRSSDFSGRTSIWAAAVSLIAERPIFGWGFDDNASVIMSTGFPHNAYHNGYLDLAVRGGFAALLVLVFFLSKYFAAAKRLSSDWAVPAMAFVYASLVYNATEVTFMSARNIIWVISLAILTNLYFARLPTVSHYWAGK